MKRLEIQREDGIEEFAPHQFDRIYIHIDGGMRIEGGHTVCITLPLGHAARDISIMGNSGAGWHDHH